jgi:acyl-coenzyme A thioesterase PaaI-like protein
VNSRESSRQEWLVDSDEEVAQLLYRGRREDVPALAGAGRLTLFEVQMHTRRPAAGAPAALRAAAACHFVGNNLVFGEVSLADAGGTPIARATATFARDESPIRATMVSDAAKAQ